MKTSLILIVAATLSPVLMLVDLGGTVAFGIFSVLGVSAMITNDYGPKLSYHRAPTKVRVARIEQHPLAA